ncbi:SMP-30/gluconolactonase/LRE family protein [Porphyrobacter sp. SLTP]|uniref:SMP-30/gluconolactonase/LRE family protein n=1 Tax=Porphyrobacter sp. SLTP TaxID=2683266 RepID=UPI00141377EE|nr:SMP-30/gluconolactonase/LRE family protein [Porphyrobacter sp. SLTP]NBB25647.1 SMP-30/gluconolactonase/LRE family protein [Porphyrobacter sp. SLTP]
MMGRLRAGLAALAAMTMGSGALAEDTPGLVIPETLELAATGYTFTEGPAWDGARIIFSDIPGDAVHVLVRGESAARVLYAPSANANGHTFDLQGRLINAEHGSGAITRWTPEGGREVIVAAYQGKRLNSPNDVVVRSDGLMLFTDPPYGLGQRTSEVGFSGVYAFDEASGRMVLIDDGLSRPNGLALSPDERVLYVGDTATQTVWAYDLAADGTASGKRLVVDVTDDTKPGRVDGLRVDTAGRVWFTCPGGVCVVDPASGAVIERLATPKRATNLAWGGADLSELYITAQTDVYRVKTRAKGIGSSSR